MCVRWLATVRSPRNSAAATSRLVRPSATRRGDATLGRPSARPRAYARRCVRARPAPSRPRWPRRAARSRRAPRRSRRGRRASAVRASERRRARAARETGRTDRRPLRAARPPAAGATRRDRRRPAAAATRPRQRVTCASTHSRSTRVASASQTRGLERRRRPDRAREATPRGRRSTSGRSARPSRAQRLARRPSSSNSQAAARVAAPERDEPENGDVLGRVERELLLAELEGSLRMGARELELAAMDGDDGDRKVILRHLEPVLDRDVVGADSVLGRERPASRPELDPGETPERAGAPRLVALEPLSILALEQSRGPRRVSRQARACSRRRASPPAPAARRRRRSQSRGPAQGAAPPGRRRSSRCGRARRGHAPGARRRRGSPRARARRGRARAPARTPS